MAYQSYYTHQESDVPGAKGVFERLRAALGNGYRNSRYSMNLSPALSAGRLIAALVPPLRWPVDASFRYLPRIAPGEVRHVLDIGCANGAWLEMARASGWRVAGVEPDPVSSKLARQKGIEVRGRVEDWLNQPGTFDYVTSSHVIEHVHDPVQLVRHSFALLRPGGGLYFETPNIDAIGHALYGRSWLGLDPPRHLVLFNHKSLAETMKAAGFIDVRLRKRPAFALVAEESRRIEAGLDRRGREPSELLRPLPGRITRLKAALASRNCEFLAMTAVRPIDA